MYNIWEGKLVNIRCLKSADVNSFFYKDRLYHRLNQGNFEIIYSKDVENLNNYYRQFIIPNYQNDFVLMIEDKKNNVIGALEVERTSQREGHFFISIYLSEKYQIKDLYFETLEIILKFMFDELRYYKAQILVSSENGKILGFLYDSKCSFEGVIQNRFIKNNEFYDQYFFGINCIDYHGGGVHD